MCREYVSFPLVNTVAELACSKTGESQVGHQRRDTGRGRAEWGKKAVSRAARCAGEQVMPRSHVAKYKLIVINLSNGPDGSQLIPSL